MPETVQKPRLAESLPPPPAIDENAIQRIRSEARADRAVLDSLVVSMESLKPTDLKIRLK